jgi:transposase
MSKSQPWKSNMIRPNRRKKVFSKKLNKWLNEEEEKILLEMLQKNKQQLTEALAREADVKEEPKE